MAESRAVTFPHPLNCPQECRCALLRRPCPEPTYPAGGRIVRHPEPWGAGIRGCPV